MFDWDCGDSSCEFAEPKNIKGTRSTNNRCRCVRDIFEKTKALLKIAKCAEAVYNDQEQPLLDSGYEDQCVVSAAIMFELENALADYEKRSK